jgi:hypothetical protein
MMQYSKKAMPQLTRMAIHTGESFMFRRCPYQAKVMKMLERQSRPTVFHMSDL